MPARALAAARPGGRHSHSCGGEHRARGRRRRRDTVRQFSGRRAAALRVAAIVAVAATVVSTVAAPVFAQTPASQFPPPPLVESPPSAQELARAQALVRANALQLAQEILEARAPALQPAPAWLAWERQLWVVYRLRGRWAELLARARPRAHWPPAIRREARLQAIKSLNELGRAAEARRLIQAALADADASPAQRRQARRALIAGYLADDSPAEARRALREFQARYGAGAAGGRLQLTAAAAALRAGDADAVVSQLATVDSAPARLLKLYARLVSRSLPPAEVAAQAQALLDAPAANPSLARSIHAVAAAAHRQSGARYPLAEALEAYLAAPPPTDATAAAAVYPVFTVGDLLDAYARIARHQIARAGLPAGDRRARLDYALGLPPALQVARKALFADLAATVDAAADAGAAQIRRAAVDRYVDEVVTTGRIALIPLLFATTETTAPLGELSLGGRVALRLSAAAVAAGDFRLAADANAASRDFPADADRRAWLLRAGRVDLFAGRHARGAAKLDEYLESFAALDAAQTDAVLQVIFDLQTLGRHRLALPLLRKVDARAPRGKHQREIAFWRAESYAGDGQHRRAAASFLHSALQAEDGFDRWGRAARALAAAALVEAGLFGDARNILQDLLAGATDARRRQLRQELQRVQLLEAGANSAPPAASPPDE